MSLEGAAPHHHYYRAEAGNLTCDFVTEGLELEEQSAGRDRRRPRLARTGQLSWPPADRSPPARAGPWPRASVDPDRPESKDRRRARTLPDVASGRPTTSWPVSMRD